VTQPRHAPIRTCIGCGQRDRQDQLLRIARDADGVLRVDAERRLHGRGGYMHARQDCWTLFTRRKGMVRSWRAAVDRPARAALVALLTAAGAVE
jgi:predicted RNA-binding protein YlxR (DUF448 family)